MLDGWRYVRFALLDLVLLRPYTVENGVDRGNSWIKIYHGNDQGLESGPRFEFPTVGAIDVVVADLNGDSTGLDLAVSQYESRSHRKLPVLVFWNGGRGGFSAQRRTDLPGESPSALLAADLDYDGHNDLLVVNHKLTIGEPVSDPHRSNWGSITARRAISIGVRRKASLPIIGPTCPPPVPTSCRM